MSASQDRRPGLRNLAEAIAKRHPDWTEMECVAVAKNEWTMQAFDQLSASHRRDVKTEQDNVRITARKSL
jgi:hypothetical protein